MIMNDTIMRTPVEGILIGTNRSKKLNDIYELLLYNGESFDLYPQILNEDQ
jgi:hypothetical protein